MKKISTLIEPRLWKNWSYWVNSPALKKASEFPFAFIQNMMGGEDTIDDEFKDFWKNYLRPNGNKRQLLLSTFKRSNRMTVLLSEWMGQIFVHISLYETGKKESSFELIVMFKGNSGAGYAFSKPPVSFS